MHITARAMKLFAKRMSLYQIRMMAFLSLLLPVALALEQVPLITSPLQTIPLLGFGTWNLERSNASTVVSEAIRAGYVHIDCAAIYGDEKEVGTGLRKGLEAKDGKRDDIWVTSKLWNDQ